MTPERWRQITDVFHASLERNTAGREAFLDRACAGDDELRAQVEAMLRAHGGRDPAMALLDQGPMETNIPPDEIEGSLPAEETAEDAGLTPLQSAQALSQYRVLEKAGAGGMSVVYKALDLKLNRHVALKFLPMKFAADRHALERFQREARAIAALDHPNICTIYSIAEDSRRPFIVMQWVDGQTLSQRIAGEPLPIDEVIGLGIQIADALEKVHAQGITHRDIKPANLMVTREGQAKILDFGIAKFTEPERRVNNLEGAALTERGMIVGTVGYMSPEQVLGQPLDPRSDLFSLGVVLYEMATATSPFHGQTAAAFYDEILHRNPPPPSTLNSMVPLSLDRIIQKALEKAPEHRYQSASALSSDLHSLGLQDSTLRSSATSSNRLTTRWTLGIGVSLIGLVAVAWWGLERNALDFKPLDTVMLGATLDSTGEAVPDGAIGHALRVALEQSHYVDVLPAERVHQALVVRQKTPDAIASEDVAREICRAEGAKLLINTALARAANAYELGMRSIDCATGRTVLTLREPVASRAEVLHGVDNIARNLRLELGESTDSMTESPLKTGLTTTNSLDALKFFIDGNALAAKGRYDDARIVLSRAVQIDPEFAQAYASLGLLYASGDLIADSSTADRYFKEALKRLDRVTERERLEIQALSYASIGDDRSAASYSRLLVDAYPKVSRYHFNLANILRRLRQPADAIREYEESLRLEPNSPATLINIAVSYAGLEQTDQEKAYYEKAFAMSPDLETDLIFNHQYGWLLAVRGEEESARAFFNKMLGKGGAQKARGLRSLGILALYEGRFAEAQEHLQEAGRLNEVSSGFNSAGRDLLYIADALVLVGRAQEGVRQLDRALALSQRGSAERSTLSSIANTYARAGQLSQASKVLALLKMKARPENVADTALILQSEGELALARRPTEESIETLRRAKSAVDAPGVALSLAAGLMHTGHDQEAIALYESVLAKPAPAGADQVRWVLAHRELGRLYAAMGQNAKARSMYQKMLDLWAGADHGLQPLEDVRRALTRLAD